MVLGTETNPRTCQKCKGEKYVDERVYDRGGHYPHSCAIYGSFVCSMCSGKGYVTDEDRAYWYNQIMAAFR